MNYIRTNKSMCLTVKEIWNTLKIKRASIKILSI